ncbi:ABC transporter substrate-binding protein [Lysobacter korlensis]|uniref:ABC transporter substrate-binding protein n=1 Tax=Lysobacter korlensis TaxID=553636 RepID=A0ABV6RNV3_9GAMM
MNTVRNKGRLAVGAVVVGAALALSGCAQGDPLTPAEPSETGGGSSEEAIVIGSQAYYSNEILAEIYAQALENAGIEVERQFNIGQREAYLPALENGEVDLFPEYTGNLLQYYVPDTEATQSDQVYTELEEALPDGLAVLEQSAATDQDSYNVTSEFAEEHSLTTLGDLAGVDGLVLGGAPELEERPYGPSGLQEVYGVDVEFSATGDTTVEALLAGEINIANVYSADPRIGENDLVTLEDPEGLFLASNVVPLVNADVADQVADVINEVSATMTPEMLVELNVQSTVEQQSSADIATAWLTENGLI